MGRYAHRIMCYYVTMKLWNYNNDHASLNWKLLYHDPLEVLVEARELPVPLRKWRQKDIHKSHRGDQQWR